MKTNSKKQHDLEAIIEKPLKNIQINKLAKACGFYKRKPQKIGAKNLIISFLMTIWGSNHNTYSVWASKLGLLINGTVSKQAVAKRINGTLVMLLKNVLQAIMRKSQKGDKKVKTSSSLKPYKRILVEDSTSIHLNDSFSKDYPSIKMNGKRHATMKIQTVYEVIRNKFLNLEITSFTDNDQSYAMKVLELVKPGDLLIRDLGYFVLRVFKILSTRGVYFISRLKKGVNIYQEEDRPIDLASMLKKRGTLDIDVFLGKEERTPARLIAIPVDQEVASIRRMKANKYKNHGYRRRKNHLFLLGWNLIITNIPNSQMSNIEIYKTYSLRWRIEIIFKSWKSCMGITRVPNDTNRIRLEVFIYCMLINILLFQVHYYNHYIKKKTSSGIINGQIKISLIKFIQFAVENMNNIIYDFYLKKFSLKTILNKHIPYYCVYESRKDRVNFNHFLAFLG